MSSLISEVNNGNDTTSLSSIDQIDSKIKIILGKSIHPEETFLHFSYIKLYISYEPQKEFQFTNLEGVLCLVANRNLSCLYLQIFDLFDFKKQFEIELYTNIESGMSKIHKNFYCIEYPTFFLGLMFMNEQKANEMRNAIVINSTILNGRPEQFSFENKPPKKNLKRREKKIKIEKVENLVTIHVDNDTGEIEYDISRGVNKFLEGIGVSVSDLNYEYETIRDRIKLKREKKLEEQEDNQQKEEKKVKNEEEAKENENIEYIINAMNLAGKEDNEEKDEIEMIRSQNKLKKKNYMIKNDIGILKVTSVSQTNINNIIEESDGSDSDGSIVSKKSKMSKLSKKNMTFHQKISNLHLPVLQEQKEKEKE